ncbi:MAG: hypothetical protein UY96_C0006G0005 [Parcubacteria group bacterium GW2011_GWB1_56_8]|nr:MAG: hypothetical protein UY96_C0006G0005 [Parcubacteria group bacterium GW2011_GWB1_56_8]
MAKRTCIFFLFLVLIRFPFIAFADQASSTNFRIESGVVDAGGEKATATSFILRTSLGQPATGISSSTSFILRGGFLNFPLPVTATATPTTTPPGGGGTVGVPPAGGGVLPPVGFYPPSIIKKCDFNDDRRCNLIDFSILLFFYEQTGAPVARYDLNSNTRVDFPDISVLMYYWTG